ALVILGNAEYRLFQIIGTAARQLDSARTEESEPARCTHPQYAARVFDKTVHVVRRQSIFDRIRSPLIPRERTQARWCGEPHCAVRCLKNRSVRVRTQAVSHRVGGEFSGCEPAHTTAQSAGPDCSVPAL